MSDISVFNYKTDQVIRDEAKIIIQKFLDSLNKSYKARINAHASDILIKAFVSFKFTDEVSRIIKRGQTPIAEKIAYLAAKPLFERYLEHGCKVGGNGHHNAQDLSVLFRGMVLTVDDDTEIELSVIDEIDNMLPYNLSALAEHELLAKIEEAKNSKELDLKSFTGEMIIYLQIERITYFDQLFTILENHLTNE